MVSEGFIFPKVDLETGFRLWLTGLPDHTTSGSDGEIFLSPIPPLRWIHKSHLPHKRRKKNPLREVRSNVLPFTQPRQSARLKPLYPFL